MAVTRGAGTATIDGDTFDVLDATLSGQVDESLVEAPAENTAPANRAYYNPVLNLSMNVIGDATGVTTLSYKSLTAGKCRPPSWPRPPAISSRPPSAPSSSASKMCPRIHASSKRS